jgi:micrococcal nuclease
MRRRGGNLQTAGGKLTLLLFFLLLPSLALNFYLLRRQGGESPGIRVIGVIDGDTLVLEGKVRLRLRHVDAPELDYCGGEEAKRTLEGLVNQRKVVIREKILDQYGRPMALVYQNGVLVNLKMIQSGWARYHSDQTSATQVLKQAARNARAQKLGIFGPECRQNTNAERPDCRIKGNIDKSTRKKLYYYPGCAQYRFVVVEKDIGENWFCSEEEARRAGFAKAKTCH